MRDLFHVPEGIYLQAHSVGAMPKGTERSLEQAFDLWKTGGVKAWDYWLEMREAYREQVAELLGAQTDQVTPVKNVTTALAKVLSILPERPPKNRHKILLSQDDFPTVGYILQPLEEKGYELVYLSYQKESSPESAWRKALNETVILCHFTHVSYGKNQRLQIGELVSHAKACGALTVVDICQSVGVVPIDLKKWQADVVIGSCVKWLCGGPGAAFMIWDQPFEHQNNFRGWFSHEDPMQMNIHDFRYHTTALRFQDGTPSVFPFLVALSSLRVLKKIGIETILDHNQKLQNLLQKEIESNELGKTSMPSPTDRGGTLVVEFNEPEKVMTQLKNSQVVCDSRPGYGIRFSPHIYNNEEEVFSVIEILKNL